MYLSEALLGLLHAEMLKAVMDKQRDVGGAVAEAGKADAERGEASGEFGGKVSDADVGLEAAAYEGDDACAFGPLSAQEAQQAGLRRSGQALGFGEIDEALARRFGIVAGESLFGFAGCERDEWAVVCGAELVEGVCDGLVSAARFAGEGEAAEVGGYSADLCAELRAGYAVAEERRGGRVELARCGSGSGGIESGGDFLWSHTGDVSAGWARG
jgi:hypothetical protein